MFKSSAIVQSAAVLSIVLAGQGAHCESGPDCKHKIPPSPPAKFRTLQLASTDGSKKKLPPGEIEYQYGQGFQPERLQDLKNLEDAWIKLEEKRRKLKQERREMLSNLKWSRPQLPPDVDRFSLSSCPVLWEFPPTLNYKGKKIKQDSVNGHEAKYTVNGKTVTLIWNETGSLLVKTGNKMFAVDWTTCKAGELDPTKFLKIEQDLMYNWLELTDVYRFHQILRKYRPECVTMGSGNIPDYKDDAGNSVPLNNCFFLAALAALAHHDPGAISQMVTENPDCSYTVKFCGVKNPITVRITKEEMNLYAMAICEDKKCGGWAAAVAKAYGMHMMSQRQAKNPALTQHNGSPQEALEFLTCLKYTNRQFAFQKSGLFGTSDKFYPDKESKNKLKAELCMAFSKDGPTRTGALVAIKHAIDYRNNRTDRGIYPGHAYTIVGFDCETGRITLRNPHGGRQAELQKKRPDEVPYGDVFTMSFDEFTDTFTAVMIPE